MNVDSGVEGFAKLLAKEMATALLHAANNEAKSRTPRRPTQPPTDAQRQRQLGEGNSIIPSLNIAPLRQSGGSAYESHGLFREVRQLREQNSLPRKQSA